MLTAPNFGFTVTKELPKRVLLVVLDEQQCLLIESALREAGFEVSIALERNNALRLMNEENPQVIIVDGAIADIGDILLCKSIRAEMNMPETSVIRLSGPQSGLDIPLAPHIGVDADLQRPFAMEELLAKIAELHSRHPAKGDRRVLTAGAIKMVPEQWLVFVDGESVNLTEKEYRLLQELMEVRGRVLTRETLLERVWGHQKSFNLETRTLDVHMSRLRTKLGSSASSIITVRNVGYRMNVAPEWLRN
ncbi:MAG: DNA-binding response regulator [Lysobacterales bacterium]|nr:MAG: DNA-binding response regulator [Xanthomonadales bacterium]